MQELHDIQHRIDSSRPDTIIDYKDDKGIIILDAKYYKIGNLPGEYDINKQLRYAEYCAKQYYNNDEEDKIVYNIFILPNSINEDKPYNIESFATNENSLMGENKTIDGRQIVAVCYVDTKKIILSSNSYWKEKLDDILDEVYKTYKLSKEEYK